MPTADQRAQFLARVARFADYLVLARDRCDDRRLAYRINEAIKPLDELMRPPSHVAAQTGVDWRPRHRPMRRDGPLDGDSFNPK